MKKNTIIFLLFLFCFSDSSKSVSLVDSAFIGKWKLVAVYDVTLDKKTEIDGSIKLIMEENSKIDFVFSISRCSGTFFFDYERINAIITSSATECGTTCTEREFISSLSNGLKVNSKGLWLILRSDYVEYKFIRII